VRTARCRWLGVLSVCVAAALAGGATWSQNPTVVVDHPAGITRLLIEHPGTDPASNGPASRFQLRTMSGDPRTPNDDDLVMASELAPYGSDVDAFSSITTISIDMSDANATDQVLADLSLIQDGGSRAFWPLPPTAGIRDILYRMLVPIDDTDPAVALEKIQVAQDAVLLRDTVKLDFILTNQGTLPHTVGLRIFIDPTFGMSELDGTSIILSDGTVVDHEENFSAAAGGRIPDGWVSFDSTTSPAVILRGTITGGEVSDPGMAWESAGPPDVVEFGQRVNMGRDNQWDFVPNPSAGIAGEDWGYAVKWDEELLPPGGSRRYVTYFGLGGSVSDFSANPSYVLAAYAPYALRVVEGDDPITPATETEYLGDENGSSTWAVLAYCDNWGAGTITDARATISFDEAFVFDQTVGQSRTVLLGSIPRNAQAQATWKLRTAPDVVPGIHEIRVTGPLGRTVTRKVSIPALPTLPQDGLGALDLSMVTVPYYFQQTDAEHVFQSLGGLPSSNAQLIRWDPSAAMPNAYKSFPDNYVANIEPGAGYWLRNRLRTTIVFPADHQVVPTTEPFSLVLVPGWSQIGSPFISTIRLQDATVVGPDGVSHGWLEAGQAGLITSTIFAYDPTLGEYGDYTYPTTLAELIMEPYRGYWIQALRPVTLTLPAPTLMPFRHTGAKAAVAATILPADGWRADLTVQAAGIVRTHRVIGQSKSASDGPDIADIMSPPEALADGSRLAAYFLRMDWGPRSGCYVTDIRSDRPGPRTWSFVVDTSLRQQDATISWPDLSQMPPYLTATLEDVQAGRSCFMRTARCYTYNCGSGGPRQFRIVVRDRGAGALQILSFGQAQTGGGVQMSCRLTAAAAVDVMVRNMAGRLVKQVWQGRAVPAGEQRIIWNGQDARGLSVPNGSYVVEINANSPETGERTGVMRVVQYRR